MTFVRIGRPSIGTAAEPLPRLTAAWIDVAVKHVLWFDGEFRSVVDLKEVGLHKYATHPTTDVWFVAFAIDDGPVQIWSRGDPVPAVWFEAAADPSWAAHAHNAAFDVALDAARGGAALRLSDHPARALPLHHGDGAGAWAASKAGRLGGRTGAGEPQGCRRRTADAPDVEAAQAAPRRGSAQARTGMTSRRSCSGCASTSRKMSRS